jgi:hypothetical protein
LPRPAHLGARTDVGSDRGIDAAVSRSPVAGEAEVTAPQYRPPMVTRSASDTDTVGGRDDIQQMRARITELENELRALRVRAGDPASDRGAGGPLRILSAVLAATTVFTAWPAFLTFRRWWRWWQV